MSALPESRTMLSMSSSFGKNSIRIVHPIIQNLKGSHAALSYHAAFIRPLCTSGLPVTQLYKSFMKNYTKDISTSNQL